MTTFHHHQRAQASDAAPAIAPAFGFSLRHDAALQLCIASGRVCAFGCAKDGAPNCYAHVVGAGGVEQCEFGKQTAHLTQAKTSQ